jgi:predicted HTH domain antitoxin
METVTLELTVPEDVYFTLQSEGFDRDGLQKQAQLDLAVNMYRENRLSIGKAASLAGITIQSFWAELIQRGQKVFDYTEEDYTADRVAIAQFILQPK